MTTARTVGLAAGCAAAVLLAGCNLWPGGLGHVDLPYDAERTREVTPRRLDDSARAPSRTVEQGMEELRAREPVAEGEPPRAVQEVLDGLVGMSVEQFRLDVLRNNLDLQVALYDPEIAGRKVSEEEGKFDAVIGGKYGYYRGDTPELDGPLSKITSDDPLLDGAVIKQTEIEQERENQDIGVGLKVPLPTGGTVALESLWKQKSITDPQRFDQYLAATRFSFSQPLLRGGGTRAALAPIRMARVGERISEVQTKLKVLAILAKGEKAYWRLYAARRFLDVRAEQFRLAEQNLEVARARIAQGVSPEIEDIRAELSKVGFYEAVVVAETDWRLRQRELKTFLVDPRLPLDGTAMIETSTEPLLASLELDRAQLVDAALAERLDLIELELRLVRNGLEVGLRENQILPLANLDFSYGTLERDNGLGSAWDSQWDLDHDELFVGFSFEIPFTNQRRVAQLDSAILKRAKTMATRRSRELQVRREVLDMVDIVEQNWRRIVAARQKVVVAGANYEAEVEQFEQGVRTQREVFEALSSLGDAQISEIKAIVDYQVAQIDLAFATGTLLGYAKVDLGPLRLPAVE